MDCGTEIQALLSGQYLYKKFSSVFVDLLFQFPVLSNVYFLFFFTSPFLRTRQTLPEIISAQLIRICLTLRQDCNLSLLKEIKELICH